MGKSKKQAKKLKEAEEPVEAPQLKPAEDAESDSDSGSDSDAKLDSGSNSQEKREGGGDSRGDDDDNDSDSDSDSDGDDNRDGGHGDSGHGDNDKKGKDTRKNAKSAKPKLDSAHRSARTIFVGNLDKNAKRKEVERLFRAYSPVEAVRVRSVIPENPNIDRKRAYLSNQMSPKVDTLTAYVVFCAVDGIEEIVQKACKELNMTVLHDKHLRVSRADDDAAPGSGRFSAFVGNLPFDCQDEELITAFLPVAKKVGASLLNVRVNRDKETGIGRGVGFVTFDDELAVQACVNKSGELKVRKNKLRISVATKQKNRNTKTFKRGKRQAQLNKRPNSQGGRPTIRASIQENGRGKKRGSPDSDAQYTLHNTKKKRIGEKKPENEVAVGKKNNIMFPTEKKGANLGARTDSKKRTATTPTKGIKKKDRGKRKHE